MQQVIRMTGSLWSGKVNTTIFLTSVISSSWGLYNVKQQGEITLSSLAPVRVAISLFFSSVDTYIHYINATDTNLDIFSVAMFTIADI